MRHIPEEELHAYLDQALSRAQAVEIESHLASCARCRAERDAIAGLRDRTTALLATLAPGRTIARPAWGELRRRHQLALVRRANLLRAGVWAASLVGALSLGYAAHSIRDRTLASAEAPAPTGTLATPAAHLPVTTIASAPRRHDAPAARTGGHPVRGVEVDTLSAPPSAPSGGLWRTESLERAMAAGYNVPRVAGLPVLQIQVQEASSPLVAVDQQLTNGATLRTIEGPAREIAALDQSEVASTASTGTETNSLRISRTGNRMLLMTARIPPDSLRALLARLKTK